MRERADYVHFAWNSVVISVGATLLAIVIAVPAAYAMAFFPGQADQGPPALDAVDQDDAGGRRAGADLSHRQERWALLDTRWGLIVIYMLMNLPIVVWLLYTFFKEVPKDILEAGRMDGAKPKQEVWMLLMPLSLPGIASTGLLSIILCWNEAFWSLNLTSSNAAPLTAFIASFSAPEGLFWAKLSAASTVAIAPILVFGWMSQQPARARPDLRRRQVGKSRS